MINAADLQTPGSPASSAARRQMQRYLAGSLALLLALVAYCELCSAVHGQPLPGLRISAAWAVTVALGWMLVGAALGMFGPRIAASRLASQYPRALLLACVMAIAVLTLLFEALLRELIGNPLPLTLFIFQRAPMNLAASALLVTIYVVNLNRRRMHGASISDREVAAPVLPRPALQRSSVELLDVMTGTGRSKICVAQIECLLAEGNYINVVHVSGRTYLLRQTLAAVERSLGSARFVRVHRSTLVNREWIRERRPGDVLVLQSGRTVKIGRAFRDRLG